MISLAFCPHRIDSKVIILSERVFNLPVHSKGNKYFGNDGFMLDTPFMCLQTNGCLPAS